MTEAQLQEVFWRPGGWADQIYARLQQELAAGKVAVDLTLDLNPPERYEWDD